MRRGCVRVKRECEKGGMKVKRECEKRGCEGEEGV